MMLSLREGRRRAHLTELGWRVVAQTESNHMEESAQGEAKEDRECEGHRPAAVLLGSQSTLAGLSGDP
jgi:hypothetical protein